MILNRLNIHNLNETFIPDPNSFDIQVDIPYIIYRNKFRPEIGGADEINGLWFHDRVECLHIGDLLHKIINSNYSSSSSSSSSSYNNTSGFLDHAWLERTDDMNKLMGQHILSLIQQPAIMANVQTQEVPASLQLNSQPQQPEPASKSTEAITNELKRLIFGAPGAGTAPATPENALSNESSAAGSELLIVSSAPPGGPSAASIGSTLIPALITPETLSSSISQASKSPIEPAFLTSKHALKDYLTNKMNQVCVYRASSLLDA